MGWFRSGRGDIGFCSECGEDCTLLRRSGLAARVRYFLVYGMPAPEVWTCRNGHETGGRAGTKLTFRESRMPRFLQRATQTARVIHRERSMEPVPLTYLMAAGVGVALGAVLDVWLGWPWWLITTGGLLAIWLGFLSTAFRPANQAALLQRLRYVIDAEDAHRRELTAFAARVNADAIAAFGVVGWEGPIGLGGWTRADAAISSVTLAHHVDDSSEAPAVEVEYHCAERHAPNTLPDQVREEFVVNSIEAPPSAQPGDLARLMTRRRWQALHEPLPAWQQTTMEVDGAAVTFATLHQADTFVALAPIDGGHLVVRGSGFQPGSLTLGRVADITPYVEGTLAQMAGTRR